MGEVATCDKIAAEESVKNPFFKKVLDSQPSYASIVVPAKRFALRRIRSRPTITGLRCSGGPQRPAPKM